MNQTEHAVKEFIFQKKLLTDSETILIGISGGPDSVVLFHILHKLGYKCILAHCNFHLRGEESDRDMHFVETLAEKYDVKLNITHFNANEYANSNHISIEMAARELRYKWFDELRQQYDVNHIAIAHHSDDIIETFFINLMRGCGLHGLTGIKAINGAVIRPLLCLSRKDILNYIASERLNYVTDSTNNETEFLRNKIRNIYIPLFEETKPQIKKILLRDINNLQECESFLQESMSPLIRSYVIKEADKTIIKLSPLSANKNYKYLLYEILNPYGFNSHTIEVIADLSLSTSGQEFLNEEYKLLKNRDTIEIIELKNIYNQQDVFIDENTNSIESPIKISLKERYKENIGDILKDKNHCYLDKNLLIFPLRIRHWQNGDYFYPFGLNKKQKLSDFFVNNKVSKIEKEKQLLLVNGDNQIIWIIGLRPDNRFRISEKTNSVLELSL